MRWWCGVGAIAVVAVGCAQRAPGPSTTVYPAHQEPDQIGIASWYGPGFHGRRTSNGEIYDQHALTAAHRLLPHDTEVRVTNLENGRAVEVRINDRGPFVDDRIIDLSYGAARRIGMIGPGTARVRVEVLTPLVAPDRVVRSSGGGAPAVERAALPATEESSFAEAPLAVDAGGPAEESDWPVIAEAEAVEEHARQEWPVAADVVAERTWPVVAAIAPAPVRVVEPASPSGPAFVVHVATFSDPGRAEHLRDVIGRRFPEAFVAPLDGADGRSYRVRLGPYPLREGAVEDGARVNRLGYPAIVMEHEGL